MKYLNTLSMHHRGEDPVDWSPHVYTQQKKDMAEILTACTGLEGPAISFQSLTLQPSLTSSSSMSDVGMPLSPMTADDETMAAHSMEPQQREVFAPESLNLSTCCFNDNDNSMLFHGRGVSLEPRKSAHLDVRTVSASSLHDPFTNSVSTARELSLKSTSSAHFTTSAFDAHFFPPAMPTFRAPPTGLSTAIDTSNEQRSTSRSKRQRGGSDFSMTNSDSGDCTPFMTASPMERCKRRRLNRNRALVAQEFDSILSQISNTESY